MGREKTGLPKEISSWRDIQYLDLEHRTWHIPPKRISWHMLDDDVKRRLSNLESGRYSSDGSTFEVAIDDLGRVAFIPINRGESKYGMCVYGSEISIYGTATYGGASYCEYIYSTGEYGGTGGYGNTKYA